MFLAKERRLWVESEKASRKRNMRKKEAKTVGNGIRRKEEMKERERE